MLKLLMFCVLLVLIKGGDVKCENTYPNWRPKLSFSLSERERITDTIYEGVSMVVDDKDKYISSVIKRFGTYESQNIRNMARMVKEGDVLINIGSHIGLEIVLLGKLVGPKGKIFIFQPYPASFNILMKNIYINDLEDITTLHQVAISNTKQTGYIFVNYNNTSASRIYTKETVNNFKLTFNQRIDVPIDLVDNVLPKDIKIDFALIDVERLEIECLEGMKEVILRSPNLKILIQWSGFSIHMSKEEYNQQAKALLLWFEANGFKFYQVGSKQKCGPKPQYRAMDANSLYARTMQLSAYTAYMDMLFLPGHIDPNTLD